MVKLAMDIMVQVGVVECGVMVEDVLRGLVGPLCNAPMKGEMFVVPKCKLKLTKVVILFVLSFKDYLIRNFLVRTFYTIFLNEF